MIDKLIDLLPIPEKIKALLKKFREIILYLIVGCTTTIINGFVYWACMKWLSLANVPSTIAAWIIAVLFAFFANKSIVFASNDFSLKKTLTEMGQFVGCRLSTGAIDVAIMYISVDCLGWNGLLMKLVSDFIVTVINFFASKFFIFRKKKPEETKRP